MVEHEDDRNVGACAVEHGQHAGEAPARHHDEDGVVQVRRDTGDELEGNGGGRVPAAGTEIVDAELEGLPVEVRPVRADQP